jgi:hypothetical protein
VGEGRLKEAKMTKEIQMHGGRSFLVDDCDYEELSKLKWFEERGYAVTSIGNIFMRRSIRAHRIIMKPTNKMVVDHINGNKLDNRRANLRVCTRAQNTANRGRQVNNTTGYKGVHPWRYGYRSEISVNGKKYLVGYFDDPEEAARAYDAKARELLGEFASTNF